MQRSTSNGGNTIRPHKNIGLDAFAAFQYRGRFIETGAPRTGPY